MANQEIDVIRIISSTETAAELAARIKNGQWAATTLEQVMVLRIDASNYKTVPFTEEVQDMINASQSGALTQIKEVIDETSVAMESGVVSGGGVTKISNTVVRVAAGTGKIVDSYNNPTSPTSQDVSWPQTDIDFTPYLSSSLVIYYVAQTATGIEVFAGFPVESDRRGKIILGYVDVENNIVDDVVSCPYRTNQSAALLNSYIYFQKPADTMQGVAVNPVTSALSVWVSGGRYFLPFANASNSDEPSAKALPQMGDSSTPATFAIYTENGTVVNPSATVIPKQWDNNGTVTSLTGNDAAIHYVFRGLGGKIHVQLGQSLYNTATDAKTAAEEGTDSFNKYPFFDAAKLLGAIYIGNGATTIDNALCGIVRNVGTGGGGGTIPTLEQVILEGSSAGGNKITNLGDATDDGDALNKRTADGWYVPFSGGGVIDGILRIDGANGITPKFAVRNAVSSNVVELWSDSNGDGLATVKNSAGSLIWYLAGDSADSYLSPLGGYFGVGSTNPQSRLHVAGGTNGARIVRVDNASGSEIMSIWPDSGGNGYFQMLNSAGSTRNVLRASGVSYLLGGLGLGITSPATLLDVNDVIVSRATPAEILAEGDQAVLTKGAGDGWYAPITHNHAISDVTELQTELDSKASVNYVDSYMWQPYTNNTEITLADGDILEFSGLVYDSTFSKDINFGFPNESTSVMYRDDYSSTTTNSTVAGVVTDENRPTCVIKARVAREFGYIRAEIELDLYNSSDEWVGMDTFKLLAIGSVFKINAVHQLVTLKVRKQ